MTPNKHLILSPQRPMPPEDGRWLAAAVQVQGGGRVLDAGCGSGIASLSLLMRCPQARVMGVELHVATAHLARANAGLNHVELMVEEGDVLRHMPGPVYDAVMCNPPFHAATATPSRDAVRRLAHHAPDGLLAAWLPHLASLLQPAGQMYLLLHMAQRNAVAELARQAGMQGEVHALRTSPVRSAKRLLVRLHKGTGGVREGAEIAAYDPALRDAVLGGFQALSL